QVNWYSYGHPVFPIPEGLKVHSRIESSRGKYCLIRKHEKSPLMASPDSISLFWYAWIRRAYIRLIKLIYIHQKEI
ncbi:hypothetical protein KA005_72650, partial [bacterium]|nr:hypothetical protein [bacterium]